MNDPITADENIAAAMGSARPLAEDIRPAGLIVAELFGPNGELKDRVEVPNLITQVGDQMYAELGAGIAGMNTPTGMRLGKGGATAPAKSGAGASMLAGDYVAGSSVALSAAPTSGLNAGARRITYVASWAAGTGTDNGINEVVLTNAAIANSEGAEADTVARGVLAPTINKGAGDTLTVTWTHDLIGA